VSGKIKLQPNVSRDIARNGSVEAVKALGIINDTLFAYAIIDVVV
jgi:hypothetical protein